MSLKVKLVKKQKIKMTPSEAIVETLLAEGVEHI